MKYVIQPITNESMRDVLEIEIFSNTFDDPDFGVVTDLKCWTLKDFAKYWKSKTSIGLVIKEGHITVGYAVLNTKNDKVVVDKLVIHPHFRRLKLGTALVVEILAKYPAKVHQFIVRETDKLSIEFYKSFKFKSRLSQQHFHKNEDGIIFYKIKN